MADAEARALARTERRLAQLRATTAAAAAGGGGGGGGGAEADTDAADRALLAAAAAGDAAGVRAALARGAAAARAADGAGCTALALAARAAGRGPGGADAGAAGVLAALLEAGGGAPAVDAGDCEARTPLHHAALRGAFAACRVLVRAGARVDAADVDGRTPLHDAVAARSPETLAVLLAGAGGGGALPAALAAPERARGLTPLALALALGDAEAAGLLLRSGARVEPRPPPPAARVYHAALLDPALAPLLFARESARVLAVADSAGRTPAHVAAACGHLALLWRCAEAPPAAALLRSPDAAGALPLHVAAAFNQVPAVQWLLTTPPGGPAAAAAAAAAAAGIGGDIDARDHAGATPLHYAAAAGAAGVVAVLLAHGADVAAGTVLGTPPLGLAAAYGHGAVARALVAAGADPGQADSRGQTPLLLAAAAGHRALVLLLRACGAPPATPALDGRTPAEVAIAGGHVDTLHALLAPLGGAHSAPVMQLALEFPRGVSPPEPRSDTQPVLAAEAVAAVTAGSVDCVDLLLRHKPASPAAVASALRLAAQRGRVDLVAAFLDGLGDPAAVETALAMAVDDETGDLLLHIAARAGQAAVCRLLIARGADPLACSQPAPEPVAADAAGAPAEPEQPEDRALPRGVTPVDLARAGKHVACLNVLLREIEVLHPLRPSSAEARNEGAVDDGAGPARAPAATPSIDFLVHVPAVGDVQRPDITVPTLVTALDNAPASSRQSPTPGRLRPAAVNSAPAPSPPPFLGAAADTARQSPFRVPHATPGLNQSSGRGGKLAALAAVAAPANPPDASTAERIVTLETRLQDAQERNRTLEALTRRQELLLAQHHVTIPKGSHAAALLRVRTQRQAAAIAHLRHALAEMDLPAGARGQVPAPGAGASAPAILDEHAHDALRRSMQGTLREVQRLRMQVRTLAGEDEESPATSPPISVS